VFEVNVRYAKTDGFVNARSGSVEKQKKGSHGHRVKKSGTFDRH
jgi:hypothetical protein